MSESEARNQRARSTRLDADRLARARSGNLRQLLLRASRAINQDVTLALHAAGFKDLKNSQVFCLAHIDLNGTTIVDLAETSNISKQAASKLVGELVALGLLSTSPAPSDGRAILVEFTPRGRALMQRSFELFAEMERDYSRRLGAQDYQALKRALRTLAAPAVRGPSTRR